MKKLSTIIFALFIVSIIFTGCEDNKAQVQNSAAVKEITLTALASSTAFYSDCLTSDDIIIDEGFENWYTQQYGNITAQEPQSRLTVVFDGKEYSGKYDHTVVNSLGMCTNHIYQGDDLFFSIDATNGELTSIHFVYRFVDSEISDELLVSCRNEAQRIAEQYIDTSYFVLEEKNEHELGMSFIYTQFVGGMKTENYLQVSFNGQGNLDTFNIYVSEGYKLISQEGVDDTAKLVETLSSKAAEQTALNKAKSAFAHRDVKKYEIREPKLYVMPDGKLVMAYSFVAEITNNNPIRDESGNLLYSHKSAWLNVAVFEQ